MKFIITEEQKDNLTIYNHYKKGFFKYWDKFGPEASKYVMKFLGSKDFGYGGFSIISGNWGKIDLTDVQSFLREWLGGDDKAASITKELLENKTHKISNGDCGLYEFEFDVTDFENKLNGYVLVDVYIHDTRGKFYIDGDNNEPEKLTDMINNDEYGWEILGEINDCVLNYFDKNITIKTGVGININQTIYYSHVNPYNN